MMKAATLSLAFCAFTASAAQAQMTWTDKGFINVNVGIQSGSRSLATSATFDLYDEQGTLDTTQDVKGGFLFDVSGAYKVWQNLAVGVGFSRVASDADVAVDARVPDPAEFDRLRSASATATGAEHSETAFHFMGVWMMPVTDKVDVGVSFGPTIFQVKQDIPTSISVSEPGPAITATTLTPAEKTTIGFHAGVDVNYMITPRIGAGALLRYAWGSANLQGANDSLTVGGFQIGFGARVRF